MSSRNDRAWVGYDNWLLKGSGVDDIDIEVFKAEKYEIYTTDYDSIIKFDLDMIKAEKLEWCKDSYDDREEYIEECVDSLVQELNLHLREEDATEAYIEAEKDRYEDMKEAHAEFKADQDREEGR